MQKVNVSTKQMDKFSGMWIVIDPVNDRIIAAAKTFKGIASLVVHSTKDVRKVLPAGQAPGAYKVPDKDEKYFAL